MAAYGWFFAALASSILWGFSYALSEKIFKNDVPLAFFMLMSGTVYVLFCLGLVLATNQFKIGIDIVTDNKRILLDIMIVALSYVGGAFLIFLAIAEKNATLANLVEISYPIFTFLFAWLLFREVQISWQAALGGLLIFSGIGLIFWKS